MAVRMRFLLGKIRGHDIYGSATGQRSPHTANTIFVFSTLVRRHQSDKLQKLSAQVNYLIYVW